MSFGHEGIIINGSATFDSESKVVHDNRIEIIGRRGIAKLLDMVIDDEGSGNDGGPSGEPPPVQAELTSSGHLIKNGVQPGEEKTVVEGTSAAYTSTLERQEIKTDEVEIHPTEGLIAKQGADPQYAARSIPSETVDSGVEAILRVHLGRNETTGQDAFWDPYTTIPNKLTNQHVLIVGKSGSGKSETTKAMIWELSTRGVPTIIFDYQGEYAAGDFFDAVKPQVFDVMDGLPVNPFELPIDPQTGNRKSPLEMVFRLADTLNTVFSGSGDIQLGILREAIEECYVQQGISLHDSATWDQEPPTLEMLSAVLEKWTDERGSQVKNLKVRLQPLFKSGIFQQGKAGFGFDDLFKKTTVLKMTSGIKDLMLAASQFMLEKIYAAMLMSGPSKMLRAMVCIDEAHKLCRDDTVTMLIKEARKYGLGVLLSSQETRDFHPSVFANTGTLICLALEEADATVLARNLGLVDKNAQKMAKEMILNQANGRALVRSQHFLPYAEIQIKSFEDRLTGKVMSD